MGRGRPLLRICVGGRKPDRRGILPPMPFNNLLDVSGDTFICGIVGTANVVFGFESVANVEFNADSYSGLFKLPFELPDERLCDLTTKI